MNNYEKGFQDGMEYAKDKALYILCDCEEMTGHDYLKVRDAIKAIRGESENSTTDEE